MDKKFDSTEPGMFHCYLINDETLMPRRICAKNSILKVISKIFGSVLDYRTSKNCTKLHDTSFGYFLKDFDVQ